MNNNYYPEPEGGTGDWYGSPSVGASLDEGGGQTQLLNLLSQLLGKRKRKGQGQPPANAFAAWQPSPMMAPGYSVTPIAWGDGDDGGADAGGGIMWRGNKGGESGGNPLAKLMSMFGGGSQ